MENVRSSTKWLSAHLFIAGSIYSDVADSVILSDLASYLNNELKKNRVKNWFFVRYYERGPHIRVRLCVSDRSSTRVAADFVEHISKCAPNADLALYGAPSLDHDISLMNMGSDEARNPVRITALRWIAYEPEISRYGGPQAIGIAESLFTDSSEVSLMLLRGMHQRGRGARLGRGLLAMLTALRVFFNDRGAAAAFADRYCVDYLRSLSRAYPHVVPQLETAFSAGFSLQDQGLSAQIETIWLCLEAGELPREVLPLYRGLLRARAQLELLYSASLLMCDGKTSENVADCVSRILSSYVHMTNNRLGITVTEELYLARIIQKVLCLDK